MFKNKSVFFQILFALILYTFLILTGIAFCKNTIAQNLENKIVTTSYSRLSNSISILIGPIIENRDILNSVLREIENENPSIINIIIFKNGNYYTNIEQNNNKQLKEPIVKSNIIKNGEYLLKIFFSQNSFIENFKILNNYYLFFVLFIIVMFIIFYLFIRYILRELLEKEKKIKKIVTRLNGNPDNLNLIGNIKYIIDHHSKNEQTIQKLSREFEENLNIKTSILLNEIKNKQSFENKLKKSLKEKTVLLREIHHRVKNNLAIISSLIRLQSRKIEDSNTKEIFTNLVNRIKTIELIHSNLYSIDDFAHIDFRQYLDSLTKNLKKSLSTYNDKVEFDIECENIDMNVDQALACGQIINEIVTNSFKYAFTKKQKGIIYIKIDLKDNIYTISVWDNGKRKSKQSQKQLSLGIKLINEIIKLQLKGYLETFDENPYKYKFFFKKM